jgi:hypothetical protein
MTHVPVVVAQLLLHIVQCHHCVWCLVSVLSCHIVDAACFRCVCDKSTTQYSSWMYSLGPKQLQVSCAALAHRVSAASGREWQCMALIIVVALGS